MHMHTHIFTHAYVYARLSYAVVVHFVLESEGVQQYQFLNTTRRKKKKTKRNTWLLISRTRIQICGSLQYACDPGREFGCKKRDFA